MHDPKPHCLSHRDHEKRLDKLEAKSDSFLESIASIETLVCRIEAAIKRQEEVVSKLSSKLAAVDIQVTATSRAGEIAEKRCRARYDRVVKWLKVAVVVMVLSGGSPFLKDLLGYLLRLV